MVTRMMRWRPWPPTSSKKFEVKIVVRRIEGVEEIGGEARILTAEIRWKGPKLALGSLRRATVKRNFTREEEPGLGFGSVEWNEEFGSVCCLTFYKENAFHPWEIEIRIFNSLKQGLKKKANVIGMVSLNLAEFASTAEEEIELNLPLLLPGVNAESHPSLHLSLSLLELRTNQESSEIVQRSIAPAPLSPPSGDGAPSEKDEISALKAGLRKVKILKEFVSTRKSKKTCRDDGGSDGRCSARSEDVDYPYPFDTDSLDDDLDEGDVEDGKDDSSIRKSFNYGTLPTANFVGGSFYSDLKINGEYEGWVYYSHRMSDVGCSHADETVSSVHEQAMLQTSKRSLLPWRKRKLSFRSPKAKGEPLLKKGNGEEGGDDIDYDRRLLSSSDESLSGGCHQLREYVVACSPSLSDFGDDNFAVGSWESKEVVSRDGHMKLSTQVFFASIDQRSERAAGESACTALVAVIADWFQSNRDTMPIKSQFDSLIREGSLEWRNLCESQTYREKFPDKHFDLETVLQAKIRPLSVNSSKSFIGFFHPEGMDDNNSGFEQLKREKITIEIKEEEMKEKCDLCSGTARVRCEPDEASLCFECDGKVHAANFLVARHPRTLLCRCCGGATPWRASGPMLVPAVSLCHRCFRLRRSSVEDKRSTEEDEVNSGERDITEDQEEEDDESEGGKEEEQVVPGTTEPPPPTVTESSSGDDEDEEPDLVSSSQDQIPCSSTSRPSLLNRTTLINRFLAAGDDEVTSDSFRPFKHSKKSGIVE